MVLNRAQRTMRGAIGAALVALVASCGSGSSGAALVRVEVVTPPAAGASLTGAWPQAALRVAPKPVAPVDPATGLSVSPSIGPPWPDHFTVADAVVPNVPLFSAPGTPVPNGKVLTNPTWEGLALVFLVRGDQGDYLQVQIPTRPNAATAWVRKSDVALRSVPNHVVIERGARRLTVFHGSTPIFQVPVAPGLDSSPTPLGAFFVDGIAKPANPNGPYGLYQVSFTGFSDVYHTFGGGVGEVAMHGTNRPELIGQPASHGCVRMTNDAIAAMVLYAPTGTPVDVVA
ncbi:MAG: hypothetical protein JWN46_1960 [Acidimicrobiales bacterium]|nr:hypothetical protein [Acidimicrobiales bacterium]